MNYIKHKDTIASKAFNNEKFILVTDDEEVLRLTPSKTVAHERSTTIIEEEESSITFHGLQPSKGQQRQEKSVFLCEPKLKSLKLSPASFRSGNDTEYLNALEDLEKEYEELKKDEVYQIVQNDDNCFQVMSIKDNQDDLFEYEEMLRAFGILSDEGNIRCKIRILGLKHTLIQTNKLFACVLTGNWTETDIEVKDEVQIFGKFCEEYRAILLQNISYTEQSFFNNHFLIVEPGIHLAPTTITSSFPCFRRSILSNYVSGRDDASLPLLKGTILHNIFEQLATTDIAFQPEKLNELIQTYIESNLDVFYYLQTDMDAFINEIQTTVQKAQEWVIEYFKNQKDLNITNGRDNYKIRVLQVVNAEQMFTSSSLGMKGKTDLVILCEMETINSQTKASDIKRCFIPFELKTGEKELSTYSMQILVYCMLLMEKYKQTDGINGLLYYMKMNKLVEIKFRPAEVFSLIQRRNALAKYQKRYEKSKDGYSFPPMINSAHDCNRCYQSLTCSLVRLTLEDTPKKGNNGNLKRMNSSRSVPDIEDFQIDPKFQQYHEVEKMLDYQRRTYLKKWFSLLQMEEAYEMDSRATNEKEDQNFYMVELDNFDELKKFMQQEDPSDQPRSIILKFSKSFENKDSIYAFLDTIKQSDYVSLVQNSLSSSLKGHVTEKKMKKVKEGTKKYYYGYVLVRCYPNDSNLNIQKLENIDSNEVHTMWRIDNKRRSFFPLMRFNMIELVLNPEYKHHYELLVELQPPHFDENKEALKQFEPIYKKRRVLNDDQINTIEKCLLTKDYNVVLGMPGTGKTFVIVLLLRLLIERGDQILLSSYTHSAVDGILKRFVEKYPEYRDKVVRIASNQNQVDESVRDLVYQKSKFKNVKEIDTYFKSKQIFAVTCLASSNLTLSQRRFDICIIDEASQALEPVALGPILLAKKFILFGDHYQLQPLVKSKEAQDKGMQISLFERLINKNPSAVSTLRCQYRMNEDIMYISNTLIYDNRLKIDSALVRQSSIDIPHVKLIFDKKWLLDILNPERRVVFLNLDCVKRLKNIINPGQKRLEDLSYDDVFGPGSQDLSRQSTSDIALLDEKLLDEKVVSQTSVPEFSQTQHLSEFGTNKLDLKLVIYMAQTLLNCGVKPEEIAIITPLNSEKNYIQTKLNKSNVEVFTVDKSQGIDKNCVIINLSLENKGKEFLLTNPRRINVAFTRAKQKLIVIGSIVNLQKIENMNMFIDIIVAKRWVYNMEDHMMDVVEENRYEELANKATGPSKL